MTLGSALPWRACSPLGRITNITIQPRPVLTRAVRPRALLRLQSTDAGALSSPERTRDCHAATERPLSLLDRLDRTPLWLHGEEDPVVVRPAIVYPHKREAREALQRKHRSLTQLARVERRRKQARAGDWRSILHHLMRWTPTYGGVQDGIKVVIPEHSAQLLWSDYENNVWNIKSRTGCEMTLNRAADSAGTESKGEGEGEVNGHEETQSVGANKDPYIVLTGEPAAVSAAVYDILKVTKGVNVIGLRGGTPTVLHQGDTVLPPPAPSATSVATPTRVPDYPMSVPCQPYTLNIRADQIPRPKEWTIESFQHYVAALTMGRVHQSLGARLYPGADTHQRVVVQQLLDLFNDPAAAAAVSSPAFKLALGYLVRAGETFVKDARDLFASVGALGLRLDTEVYNLLAETAVKSKNLLAFEGAIRRMTGRGHAPDLRTWLLFLRMIEAEDVRRYILHAMGTKNFLSNPSTVASVSQEMADHDVHRAVQLGQDFDAFLAGLRALYGPEWRLPRRAANRYLDVFGRYSRFDECKKLLEYMFASEHCKPNTVSLNTVLTHCKLQHKVDLTVYFVRMFEQQGLAAVVDDITFHLLFEVARKTRKTYLLSAVWRYAHLQGMTKHSLRDHGLRLLAGDEHEVEYMTYWIRGLWEGPHACEVSKKALLEGLLLCDARRLTGARQLMAGPGIESNQQEQDATNPPPLSFPDHSPDHSPQHKYYLYTNFMSNLSQHHVPALPLGDFLQEALDHDRKLRKMLLNGERVPLSLVMHTVSLPLRNLKEKKYRVNPMVSWLAENAGKQEEDAAVKEMRMVAEELALEKKKKERRLKRRAKEKERRRLKSEASVGLEVGEVQDAKGVENVGEDGVLVQEVAVSREGGGSAREEEVGMLTADELAALAKKKERRLKRRAREKEKKRLAREVEGVRDATTAGLLHEVVSQKPEAAESVLEQVVLNKRTEEVLHAIQAEPLTMGEAEREDGVLEGVKGREFDEPMQEVAMHSQTEETPHAPQAESMDDLPQEAMGQENAEPLQEVAINIHTEETTQILAEEMNGRPQEEISQEVAQSTQDAVAMDYPTEDIPQAIRPERVDDVLQEVMSLETAEPIQAEAAVTDARDLEEARRTIQPQKADDQLAMKNQEAAEPTREQEAANDLRAEAETEETPATQPQPMMITAKASEAHAQVQTTEPSNERAGDLADTVAQARSIPLEASDDNSMPLPPPHTIQGEPSQPDKALRDVPLPGHILKWNKKTQTFQRVRAGPPRQTEVKAVRRIQDTKASRAAKARAARAGKILKWHRRTQTLKRVRAGPPRRAGKDRARVADKARAASPPARAEAARRIQKPRASQTAKASAVSPPAQVEAARRIQKPEASQAAMARAASPPAAFKIRRVVQKKEPSLSAKAQDDASLPPSEAPKEPSAPNPEPSPIEAAQRAAEEEQRLNEAEDREAQERAHKVLHYLMGAAAKFGPTTQARAGLGIQAGPLGMDGWRAAEAQKKTPGYLLGPSRDYEGSRIHGGR